MKKIVLFLPLAMLIAGAIFLVMQLQKSDAVLPSEDWQGKPVPEFSSVNLLDQNSVLNNQNLPKEPFILNVWASWCHWCIKEFPTLLELKEKGVPIIGITYVDRPDEARTALQKWGNPFLFVIDDSQQDFLTQALKISSAPTSYLVDKRGIIRYQKKGYSPNFAQDFLPRLEVLRQEKE